MTVIAWDGKHLVADSRASYSGTADQTYTLDCHNKIFAIRNSKCTDNGAKFKWFSFCGNIAAMDALADLILKHEGELKNLATDQQIMKPNGTLFGLLDNNELLSFSYKRVGKLFELHVDTVSVKPGKVKIFGSGSSLENLVRMLDIKDARDACLLIAQLDDSCGGEINYVTADNGDISSYLKTSDEQKQVMLKVIDELADGKHLGIV